MRRVSVLTYLPDHEPALGAVPFPSLPRAWTSGGALAVDADLLIHDSQYSTDEYPNHVGWGHSSLKQIAGLRDALRRSKHLVPFHHDPGHTDVDIDRLMAEAIAEREACLSRHAGTGRGDVPDLVAFGGSRHRDAACQGCRCGDRLRQVR